MGWWANWAGEGVGTGFGNLDQIQTPVTVNLSQTSYICISNFTGAYPSSLIEVAATYVVRGNILTPSCMAATSYSALDMVQDGWPSCSRIGLAWTVFPLPASFPICFLLFSFHLTSQYYMV